MKLGILTGEGRRHSQWAVKDGIPISFQLQKTGYASIRLMLVRYRDSLRYQVRQVCFPSAGRTNEKMAGVEASV